MVYVFINELSNNKKAYESKGDIVKALNGREVSFVDVLSADIKKMLEEIPETDIVIIAGGDGTLNHFVNDIKGITPKHQFYYYPCGSGNDFAHDVRGMYSETLSPDFIPLNDFIKNLPEVTVNGMKRRFINGIGFGIDGYCCEEGDVVRLTSEDAVNYTKIAIKGLLGKFKPCDAKVTVDGKESQFKKVWLAPSMLGKYYGGGMMITPGQNRLNTEHTLSLCVWHSSGKFKTLMAFPSVFKGEHTKYKSICFQQGHNIKVEFTKPQALQIDGETVRNVTEYSVTFN